MAAAGVLVNPMMNLCSPSVPLNYLFKVGVGITKKKKRKEENNID